MSLLLSLLYSLNHVFFEKLMVIVIACFSRCYGHSRGSGRTIEEDVEEGDNA